MLMNVSAMRGFAVAAADGEIGHVCDYTFDESGWFIRYIVVDTGGWFNEKQVLLSPRVVQHVDWNNNIVEASVTQDQIKEELAGELDHPGAHTIEQGGFVDDQSPSCWDPLSIPSYFGILQADRKIALGQCAPEGTRSVMSTLGFAVDACDGPIGYIEDLVVDGEWEVRYLAIDMHSFTPVRTVLISPEWIEDVYWHDQIVKIDHTQAEIRRSPEYSPSQPIHRDFEVALYDFYGRPHYWV